MSKRKDVMSSEEYERYLDSLKAGERGLDVGIGSTPRKGGQPMATNDQLAAAADPKKIKARDDEYAKAGELAAKHTPRSYDGMPKTNFGLPNGKGVVGKLKQDRSDRRRDRAVVRSEKLARKRGYDDWPTNPSKRKRHEQPDYLQIDLPKGTRQDDLTAYYEVGESKDGCLSGGGCAGWVLLILLIVIVLGILTTF